MPDLRSSPAVIALLVWALAGPAFAGPFCHVGEYGARNCNFMSLSQCQSAVSVSGGACVLNGSEPAARGPGNEFQDSFNFTYRALSDMSDGRRVTDERKRARKREAAYGAAFQRGGWAEVAKVAGGLGDLDTAAKAEALAQRRPVTSTTGTEYLGAGPICHTRPDAKDALCVFDSEDQCRKLWADVAGGSCVARPVGP